MIEIFQPDDITPATDLDVSNYQAGQDSDTVIVHLWNSKDDPAGQTIEPLLLAMRTEDPTRPGVYLASGVPPQDELWGRARVVGFNNRGDSAWTAPATDWTVLGSYSGLLIASIPAECAVHVELRFHPPTTAQGGTVWRHRLVGIHSEHSQPVPPALTATSRGVLPGIGDPRHSAILDGLEVLASDPADDMVTVRPGRWIHRGRLHGQITQTVQLDQADVNGDPLAAGEGYRATITVGTSMTITKSARSTDPSAPTPPPGELFVRTIRIDHQPGGASIIEPPDLEGEPVYDRYRLTPGTGLDVTIHPGQALAGETWRFHVRPVTLNVQPSTTSYIWQLASGGFEITENDHPPSDTALILWEVETDAAAIVRTVDRRTYAAQRRVITLKGTPPSSVPGEVDAIAIEEHLTVERVILHVHGTPTAGETVGDVRINGESIYLSQATDDQRPRLAFDVGSRVEGGVHERMRIRPGDVVSFWVEGVASGVERVEVSLVVWPG